MKVEYIVLLSFAGALVLAVGSYFGWRWWRFRPRNDKAPVFPRTPFFLYAKEGKVGLETFVNPVSGNLEKEYKDQLISFLESVVKTLRGGKL